MIEGKVRTEKEYRALERDSSSSLKEFVNDRKRYYKKYVSLEKQEPEEDTKASIVGKVVETLLFEPDTFDDKFIMSSLAKVPTGKMLDFINALCKKRVENEQAPFADIAKDAHKESGFEWALDTVLKKFIGSDAEIYYKELLEINKKGLIVVTADDVQNAERIVEDLKMNDVTSHIINIESNDRYIVLKQHKVENFDINGLPMKSMLDLIIIDHIEQKISPYDLKCVWAVENFYNEYYLYRKAYIQAAVYKEACYQLKTDLGLEGYKVENLKFIVCDSINYYNPLIYTLNSDDMDDAYNGFEYRGRKYMGLKEIVSNLQWAKENDIWNISKSNFINSGYVNIKG